jgi:hypothetical protein
LNTKHYSPSDRKEVVPPFIYAHDRKWTWMPYFFFARQYFAVPEIDEYMSERREGREDRE